MNKTYPILTAALLAALPLTAANYSWTNSNAGGLWSDTNNWSPVGQPGSDDTVVAPTAFGEAYVDTDVTIDGLTYNTGANSWSLVGYGSDHTMTIDSLVKYGGLTLSITSNSADEKLSLNLETLNARDGTLNLGGVNSWQSNALASLNVTGSTLVYENLNINADSASLGLINFMDAQGALAISSLRTGGDATREVSSTGLTGDAGTLYVTGAGLQSTNASLTTTLTIDNDTDYTYSGTILDRTNDSTKAGTVTLNLIKNGTGTQRLAGTNSYKGTTTINSGSLLVNGTHANAGAYQINGGLLGGSGSITTANADIVVANGGGLTPGDDGVGTLTMDLGTGTLDISAAAAAPAALVYQIAAVDASDRIDVTGTVNIGEGALDLDSFDFDFLSGTQEGTYTLISSTENIVGTLGSNTTGTYGDWSVTLYLSENSHDVMMDVTANIPEVSSMGLIIGIGALSVLVFKRRK
ncbi:MAG: autotransporter-associated beta strand repeat-containing protein [Puniceicoccales bacterium]